LEKRRQNLEVVILLLPNRLDFHSPFSYNRTINKSLVTNQDSPSGARTEAIMSNATLTVGSQFTTAKSGVTGVIQEVIQNKNGTSRVRLDVSGQPRWTTVK